MSLRINSI